MVLRSFSLTNLYKIYSRLEVTQQGISADAVFDMAPDDITDENKRKQVIRWDRKKMKFKKHTLSSKIKIEKKLYL